MSIELHIERLVLDEALLGGERAGNVRAALEGQGAAMMGAMVSPRRGADGNVEFLFHLHAHTAPAGGARVDLAAVVARASEAQGGVAG